MFNLGSIEETLFFLEIIPYTPIFTKYQVAWIEQKLKIYYYYDPLGWKFIL